MKYEAIIRAMQLSPWCILPEKLAEIMAVLDARMEAQIQAAPIDLEAAKLKAREFRVDGGIAIIPIQGTIAPKMNLLTALSGGVSADIARLQVMDAAEDEEVKGILLDIDSPGGSGWGVPELGDAIFAARKKKPVIASVNHMAASAAYWIASQASEIHVSQLGEVGSIGVFMLHQDWSKAFEDFGVKNTIIRSTPGKIEANPWEPLSEIALEELQRVVGLLQDDFHKAVARGRGVSLSTVREEFGQGRTVIAREALTKKMVDRIAAPDESMTRLQSPQARTRIKAGKSMSVREYETSLRENLGLSHSKAKALANVSREILEAQEELPENGTREGCETDLSVRDEQLDLEKYQLEALRKVAAELKAS